MKNYLPKFTFIEHFLSLKWCVIKILFIYFAVVLIMYPFSWVVFNVLARPIIKISIFHEFKFIYTKLTEAFFTEVKISFSFAFFVLLPVILIQLYKFIIPGLYFSEKKILLFLSALSMFLFVFAVLIVYFIVIPIMWNFFLAFQNFDKLQGVEIILEAKISEYIDLILNFMQLFVIAFQMPIVLFMLIKFGIVKITLLIKFRKHSIIIIFVLAALLTPPDVFSQVILASFMLLLYEIIIIILKKYK